MGKDTRTQKALKNALITTLCQIIYIGTSFVCRTIFTKLLGSEYLGVNGLFSNILTMLSFIELGIGSALVYKMYKPLKEQDENQLIIYMNFYRKVYHVIALLVVAVGLCFIPFLQYIVKEPNINLDIRILYLLFLADTVISYLYVYKKSILIADQKKYLIDVYTQIFNIGMNIVQIIALIITHNFLFYLAIKIIFDWLNNVFCSMRAEKEYPYINRRTKKDISPEDKIKLKKDVKGLLLAKVASVAFDGTDNIFISAFEGLSSVGIISNYTLVLSTINGFVNQVFYSLTASVGNLGVDSPKEQIENVLKKIYFANTLLYGYLAVGMILLLRIFVVEIWVGESYTLSDVTIVLLVLELCLRGIHYPVYMTRSALGMFQELKYVPPICAALNIGLDLVLGKQFGISGIILATVISRLFTRLMDIYVLYHDLFQKRFTVYYKMHFKYLLFIGSVGMVLFFICKMFRGFPVQIGFVLSIGAVTIVYALAVWLVYGRSEEFQYYRYIVSNRLLKRHG